MKTFRILRQEKGFSQQELAKRLGVSQQAVAKWETGAAWPRGDKMSQVADVLEISVDELLKAFRKEAS